MIDSGACEHHLRVGQDDFNLIAFSGHILAGESLEIYIRLDGSIHGDGYLAVGAWHGDVEFVLEEGTLKLELVIVGDDLMNVRLGGIKTRAFLYLHHHRGDGIDGALLLFCRLLGRAGEEAEDNRRDEDKKYFLHTNKGLIIQSIYRIYD